MSIAAMNWAWHQKLKPVPKLVLMALADAATLTSGSCWHQLWTGRWRRSATCPICEPCAGLYRALVIARTSELMSEHYAIERTGRAHSNRYRLHAFRG